MIDLKQQEIWFVTGSQHLYGPKTLEQVAVNSKEIATAIGASAAMPATVVFKGVMKTPDEITDLCQAASADKKCVGLIFWCHTFSPAKMWIRGFGLLTKPFVHLHTQYGRDIPWGEIDMDYMNLNQAAHGDREFGFICTRLRKQRKVVVGHWKESAVQEDLGVWARAACAWADAQGGRVVRFGDNMREVAVTEGDKVEAQIKLGYAVNGYGVGDLVAFVNAVSDADVAAAMKAYEAEYQIVASANKERIKVQARYEVGMRAFLKDKGAMAFTTTFEDLHGLLQLPGLAVQRLMAEGYGFGAEGDWKTAALVRATKVMSAGLKGGTSFMEDYTYHMDPAGQRVLGAHMLEVCPTIAETDKPVRLETHPLGIGGKEDPARLVFNTPAGPAINASLIDMGNRFRMIVNAVDVVKPAHALPKLPVAQALWIPQPNLAIGAAAWIYAGGAHHTAFSQAVDARHIEDYCAMANLEIVLIDKDTKLRDLKNELRWNEAAYKSWS
jgi:L-arabinose isomerase